MNAYSRKHTPIPRPFETGGVIPMTELERSKATLVERTASPEEMEEIYRKYGRPNMKLKDRKGFPMRKKGGAA